MVLIGQKWLYSGKSDYIRAKVVVLGQIIFNWAQVVVLGQSCCI